jgi:hypothetical protein
VLVQLLTAGVAKHLSVLVDLVALKPVDELVQRVADLLHANQRVPVQRETLMHPSMRATVGGSGVGLVVRNGRVRLSVETGSRTCRLHMFHTRVVVQGALPHA